MNDILFRMLTSDDIVSTDDNSSEGEDSDLEEMEKNLTNLLSNKKTCSQVQTYLFFPSL